MAKKSSAGCDAKGTGKVGPIKTPFAGAAAVKRGK